MIVGERVAERMRAEGLSQAELARRVGISQPSVFKLIHENKTGSARIHAIARELHTTPSYLMGETDDPEAELPDDWLNGEERDWIATLRQLTVKDRAAVMQLTRSLAGVADARKEPTPTLHSPRQTYRAAG